MDLDAFVDAYPVLSHVSPTGAWPSISSGGLRTAAQLIDAFDLDQVEKDRLHTVPRAQEVTLRMSGEPMVLRDQGRLLTRRDLQSIFGDGLTVEEWVQILSQRLYYFGCQREMQPFLDKYTSRGGQDVMQVHTSQLVQRLGSRIGLAAQNTGAIARVRTPQKLSDTFQTIRRFDRPKPVRVITAVGGVPDLYEMIHVVVRHRPDGTKEAIV
jgi:hypothetical protein